MSSLTKKGRRVRLHKERSFTKKGVSRNKTINVFVNHDITMRNPSTSRDDVFLRERSTIANILVKLNSSV